MKKRSLLALLLASLLALALTACGGSSGAGEEPAAEEAPDYLGTYNLVSIKMGPILVTPEEFGYAGAYMELKEDGKLTFSDGSDTEEVPYTVDGTAFSMEENGNTMTGTIQDGYVELGFTGAMLDAEGDDVIMTMAFAKEGSAQETALKEELEAAGSMDDQMEAMSMEELSAFVEEYSAIFGS